MLSRLSCAHCGRDHAPAEPATVCTACGRSLTATYALASLRDAFESNSMHLRVASMWRYAEALPCDDPRAVVSLGEGLTPLYPLQRFGERSGVPRLWVKDEGANPTGSFKARGMSAAVTAARARGARVLCAPSAGNAAGALAAYAARGGLEARVYLPEDAPEPNLVEARALGARVATARGTISDAAALMREERGRAPDGALWFDLSTLKEPYRLDGKKTMGYELYEQMGGALPDAILYPTGGGTGLLGMMKAFDELQSIGRIGPERPRMIAVQAAGCAPIVDAFARGADQSVAPPEPATIASGLRVPKAFADWWILREIRRSRGTAVAVTDEAMLAALAAVARSEGLLLCPEGAALAAALPRLAADQVLRPSDRVVLFNTASPYKYPDVLARALGR